MIAASTNFAPPPHHRWIRFSLRTLLVFMVAASLALGWIGNVLVRVRHQRQVVRRIEALGGKVDYDYVFDENYGKHAPGPKVLRVVLGDDAFLHVDRV
ncbi:MAG TPA: hypothetical protein VFV87_01025, partial [Pirellulaceae bacterium]|nr:hypothetical protein [Pirellulaceae bacterium]